MSLLRRIVLVIASASITHCAYMLSEAGLLPRASADEIAEPGSQAHVAQSGGPSEENGVEPSEALRGCMDSLRTLGFDFAPAPIASLSPDHVGCGMQEGVVVRRGPSGIEYRPPIKVSCAYALGLETFEAQVREAADAHLAESVRFVSIMGSYGCRTIRGGRVAGRLSQHAFGNAVDVGEFRTSHNRASVLQDFRDDSPAGRFLRDLADRLRRAGAFERVLDPDYDLAHRNHFHVEGRPLPDA